MLKLLDFFPNFITLNCTNQTDKGGISTEPHKKLMGEKDQNKWVDGYDCLIVYGWYIPKFWLHRTFPHANPVADAYI